MENRRVVGVIIFDDALDHILNNGGPQPSLIEPIEVKAKIQLYCLIFETKLLDVESPLNFASGPNGSGRGLYFITFEHLL